MFAEPRHARTQRESKMVARESKKGEGSRSGLIVFSACVLAAWNVDEEEKEYRVFAAKWLQSWQQGE